MFSTGWKSGGRLGAWAPQSPSGVQGQGIWEIYQSTAWMQCKNGYRQSIAQHAGQREVSRQATGVIIMCKEQWYINLS